MSLGDVILKLWPSIQLFVTELLEGIKAENSIHATKTVVREVRVIVMIWKWSVSPQAREKRRPCVISVCIIEFSF